MLESLQGSSWSSMDFGGNWRLLHYTMQKTYAPFVIVASSQDDSSEVWAVSDIKQAITGMRIASLFLLHRADCLHCTSTQLYV